ncbi:MAG: hypothetical protein Q7S12_03035 [bacterium]|nr:hypothetical protein [bacterium]
MNTVTKILLAIGGIIVAAVVVFYVLFQMPASTTSSPVPGLPTGEINTPTSPINGRESASQSSGAYARLLGESDFDSSIFNAEIADANFLIGEKAEFISVGTSYDENALPAADGFCAKLPDLADETIAKIESRESIVLSRKAQITVQIDSGRKIRDEEKNSIRLQNASARDRYVARLSALSVSNAAHKTAVEKFIAAITDAINNRRTAINSAQQTFRQALDEARLARTGLVSTAISDFKASVKVALDKSQTDCSVGVAATAIRTTLKTQLKDTYDAFVADQIAAEKLATALQAAVSARKTAVSKALTDFKLTMDTARKAFRVSFPQGE